MRFSSLEDAIPSLSFKNIHANSQENFIILAAFKGILKKMHETFA
ncbi:hypothetical protein [Flavobacterium acetivorans]|nr:hypothetical protein [Flavobacterium sp. F-29]